MDSRAPVARGEAIGSLNEILMIANRWRAPELLSSRMQNLSTELAEELGETEAASSIAFNVHLTHWRFLAGELPSEEAAARMETAQGMALANGAHWLISEVAAARVALLTSMGKSSEGADVGLALMDEVTRHYSPPKVVPFLLALGEALVLAERFEELPTGLHQITSLQGSPGVGPGGGPVRRAQGAPGGQTRTDAPIRAHPRLLRRPGRQGQRGPCGPGPGPGLRCPDGEAWASSLPSRTQPS